MPVPSLGLYWTHPDGDPTTVPCVHVVAQHPQGDTITTPCTHPPVQQHPNGDPVTTPCVHMVQQHPGGDVHQAFGRSWTTPCIHFVQQHPNGDTTTVPCIHLVQPHPQGDQHTIPCTHLSRKHPNGDTGPNVPCSHPLPVVREVASLGLRFFTNDAALQQATIDAVTTLKGLGVNVGSPRRLDIFKRPPINGDPNDNTDPFWSHYDPVAHAIQITEGHSHDDDVETIHHELGHAIVGQKCIQILTGGKPHTIDGPTDPGEAMSEGWADFIAVMLGNARTAPMPLYKGMDWERRSTGVPKDPKIEYNVGCTLWDLFDTVRTNNETDGMAVGFSELFKVYSPTLATLTAPPLIRDIDDYLTRFGANNPSLTKAAKAIRAANCG
jgi:hypothetical protein